MFFQIIRFIDREILFYFNDWVTRSQFSEWLIFVCARYLVIVFVVVLLYLWFRKSPKEKGGFWRVKQKENRQAVIFALLALGIGFIIDLVIGYIIPRPRPFVSYPELVEKLGLTVDLTSFPSTHAIAVFALATSMWMADLWHFRKWGVFLFIVAFIIALARVAAGVHYPTDIAAGIIVGVISAWIIYKNQGWIRRKIFRDFSKEKSD